MGDQINEQRELLKLGQSSTSVLDEEEAESVRFYEDTDIANNPEMVENCCVNSQYLNSNMLMTLCINGRK